MLLVIGGKDGYVERDGHVTSDEDLERRIEPRKGAVVKGLMMDFQLTLPTILKRAETYFPHQEIVTRMPDRSFHRYSFADFGKRARQLAVALKGLGLEPGDRVATLCWNHYQHLEAYLGIPCGGFVLHTLNLRLHPNDLGYIATHAGDKAVIVDRSLLPLWEQFKDKTQIEHVFVVEDSYEELLAGADPDDYEDPGAGRGHRGGDVLHERHDRDAEGRPLLAPLDRPAHARPGARRAARPARDRERRRCCRSCRCSTRTPGATRTPA